MSKNIYLYLRKLDNDLKENLNILFNPIKSEMINEDILLMVIEDDSLIEDTIKSIESDFYIDIKCFVEDIILNNVLLKYAFDYMKSNKNNLIRIKDVIEYLVLENNKDGMNEFKRFFSIKLPKEIIDTGLGFIKYGNSITASKELYIHRNTLNYRIETIKKITSLDLKKFNDSLAFYGLFHK